MYVDICTLVSRRKSSRRTVWRKAKCAAQFVVLLDQCVPRHRKQRRRLTHDNSYINIPLHSGGYRRTKWTRNWWKPFQTYVYIQERRIHTWIEISFPIPNPVLDGEGNIRAVLSLHLSTTKNWEDWKRNWCGRGSRLGDGCLT